VRRPFGIAVLLAGAILTSGCAPLIGNRRTPQPVVVTQPAVVPEGTEQQCWEEPRVVAKKAGPGVDPKGNWYSPPHTEVREVKMGRWVPCDRR